jgi:decaprenylphospho-beta-D-erythro-pentofuranosid-2-ulose 2-reductase
MNDATGMPQRVVVLGAASDLARSLLGALAKRRLEAVLLCGRDEDRLAPIVEELRVAGVAEVHSAHFDATETGSHDALAASAKALLGSIDLVVVAAGVLGTASLDELDAAVVGEQLTTNFTGPAAAMTAFSKVLRDQGYGRILVYSSVAGLRVRRSNFVYGAAKAGLDGFSQGLGDVLHGSGVSVVIVRPGFVTTKMTAGRDKAPLSATPQEVTAAILRGLETGASVVTVPKVLSPLFFALGFLPRAVWRKLPF